MSSLSFYYPKANKHLKLAGLLACSILDAFPFPIGTVAFGVIEDTFGAYSSGVCSGFSPDSLFTHHLKKRGDEHQNRWQRYKLILNTQAKFTEKVSKVLMIGCFKTSLFYFVISKYFPNIAIGFRCSVRPTIRIE